MNNWGLKNFFLFYFLISVLIPVLIFSAIIYDWDAVKNEQINAQTKQLYEGEISRVKQRVREVSIASDYIARSQIILDFLSLPADLREFTKPRVMSFFSDVKHNLGGGVEWRIVKGSELLFESSNTLLNKDNYIKTNINFDSEGNHSESGTDYGLIYSFIDIEKSIGELNYIKDVSIEDNKVKFLRKDMNASGKDIQSRVFIITLIFLLLSMLFSVLLIRRFILIPILKRISKLRHDYEINLNTKNVNNEFKILDMYIDEFLNKTKESIRLNSILSVTQQIAHDIRSPLEALRSVTGHIEELDFQHRKIITSSIQRISDIANGLLREGRSVDKVSFVNINILMEEVFQDKIFEHGSKIKFFNNTNYEDTFVVGDENSFYRVLSNILNNSFESYEESDGEVCMGLNSTNSKVVISIEDKGKGMTAEFIKKALEGGLTTKEKGNGIGLSSAQTEIMKHNGNLLVESIVNEGTKVEITLLKVQCPDWFSSSININSKLEKVVCIDDDQGFLEVYQEKLKEFNSKTLCLNAKKMEDFNFSKNYQYFFDYDLGKEKTGLDIILENGIASSSTLVTSMYQDEKIQNICKNRGIKILPKQIFNTAQVKIKKEESFETIFIDNDELMHLSWKMEASKSNKSLKTYFSVDEFILDAKNFNTNSKIYIDSDLGNGKRGETESKKIFELGFTQLYLATGYLAEDIDKPHWIIEIVGKRPKFS